MPGQPPDNMAEFLGVPERTAELIVRYIDANVSDEELAELRDALKQSDAARDLFVQWGLQAQSLAEALVPQYSESDEPISFEQLAEMEANAQAELVDLDPRKRGRDAAAIKPAHRSPSLAMKDLRSASSYLLRHALTSRPVLGSAIAALLLLALILFNPFGNNTPAPQDIADNSSTKPAASAQPTPRGSAVATLTATHNAQWAERASAPGSEFKAGDRLTLTAGFAEITTNRGAVAILEAPATVELLNNDNAIRLHAGKLVGICETESSKGFLVRTPHMDITDLGTEFGVHVEDNKVTATVFTGEIEVTAANHASQRFTAGQTAQLSVANSNSRIETRTQIASGFDALRTSPPRNLRSSMGLKQPRFDQGNIIWGGWLPNDVRAGQQTSPNLQVFIERQDHVMDRGIEVELTPRYPKLGKAFETHRLPDGQRVSVYLLHNDNPTGKRTVEQYIIDFGRPILGVILSTDRLYETDALLGRSGVLYAERDHKKGDYRGVEIDTSAAQDAVTIDGSTIRLTLGQVDYMDQVRVIVQAEGSNE